MSGTISPVPPYAFMAFEGTILPFPLRKCFTGPMLNHIYIVKHLYTMKIAVFLDVTSYILVEVYQLFRSNISTPKYCSVIVNSTTEMFCFVNAIIVNFGLKIAS